MSAKTKANLGSIADVAAEFRCSERTVRRWIVEGRLTVGVLRRPTKIGMNFDMDAIREARRTGVYTTPPAKEKRKTA